MAKPTLVGPWAGKAGAYSSPKITTSGVQAGDLLRVAGAGYTSGDQQSWGLAAWLSGLGWTVTQSSVRYSGGYTNWTFTASRVATAADVTAQAFTFTYPSQMPYFNVVMWGWRGVDATTPLGTPAKTDYATGNTGTTPVVAASSTDAVLEAVWLEDGYAASAPTLPGGLTNIGTYVDTNNGAGFRMAYLPIAATGNQAQYTATFGETFAANGSLGTAQAVVVYAPASAPIPVSGTSATGQGQSAAAAANVGGASSASSAQAQTSSAAGAAQVAASSASAQAQSATAAANSGGTTTSYPGVAAHVQKVDPIGQGTSPMTSAPVTTPASDSTILVHVGLQNNGTFAGLSDNYGNVYTPVDTAKSYAGGCESRLFQCVGAQGGAGHTWSVTKQPGYEANEVTLWAVVLDNCAGIGAHSYSGTLPATSANPITTTAGSSRVVAFWASDDYNASNVYGVQAPFALIDVDGTAGNTICGADASATIANAGTQVNATFTAQSSLSSQGGLWLVEALGATVSGDSGSSASAQAQTAAASGSAVIGATSSSGQGQVAAAVAALVIAAAAVGFAAQSSTSVGTVSDPAASTSAQGQSSAARASVGTQGPSATAQGQASSATGAASTTAAGTSAQAQGSTASAVVGGGGVGRSAQGQTSSAAGSVSTPGTSSTAQGQGASGSAIVGGGAVSRTTQAQTSSTTGAVQTTAAGTSAQGQGSAAAGTVLVDVSGTSATAQGQGSGARADSGAATAVVDPRFVAILPPRSFAATLSPRAFRATRPARAFLAVLRMHTMTIDTTEEKDAAEPALLTFDFDAALPAGVALDSAAIVSVELTAGTDPALATWSAALKPEVGQADATLPDGSTVKARRFAQCVFPAGAGVRGYVYKWRCQGKTADANVAPICPMLVPVV